MFQAILGPVANLVGTYIKGKQEKAKLGSSFRREILAKGGSREAIVSFRAFMKREPKPDAMLKHLGLMEA